MKKLLGFLLLLVLLLAGVWFFVPLKSMAEEKIKALLAPYGFGDVRFSLADADFSHLVLKDIHFTRDKITVDAAALRLTGAANLDKKSWQGTWQLDGLLVKSGENPLPAFDGTGTLAVDAARLDMAGALQAAAMAATQISFTYNQIYSAPDKTLLKIAQASMPWQGGTLAVADLTLPLDGKSILRVPLTVRHVPLDSLLNMLTGGQANATGAVSGFMPLVIKPDGSFTVETGKLEADAPGVIKLQETAIPGDNEQVALVRTILKNLNYAVLAIKTEGLKNNKMLVTLSVEGRNPDAVEGRPVKLNVQLSGDLLNLIQQNIMLLADPKSLLEQQGSHAP